MTTGPIDLDDAQLDAVTGGGNPLAGGAKTIALPGLSPLKDLAAAIDQQTGSSMIANAAKEMASGQQGTPTGKTSSIPGSAAAQLTDAINAIHALDPKFGSAASDAQRNAIAVLLKQASALDGNVGKTMADALQKLLPHADTGKADAASKKPIGSPGTSAGHLGDAMGNLANSTGQAQAKLSEADAKRDEATAQNLNSQADLKKELASSLDDMIKQLISAVKDLQDAKMERMRSFTRI